MPGKGDTWEGSGRISRGAKEKEARSSGAGMQLHSGRNRRDDFEGSGECRQEGRYGVAKCLVLRALALRLESRGFV